MDIEQFDKEIKEAYLAIFPQGWIKGGYRRGLGEYVAYRIGIQPRELHAHNIEENDPACQTIFIHGVENKAFTEKVEAEGMNMSLLIKPQPGEEWLAYSSVKTGYRKKTATPEKVLAHIIKYFDKLRTVVENNREKLAHQIEI